MQEESISIARAAQATGFSVPTLRFYEQEGIIPPVPRDAAGNRCYGKAELNRCFTIRCLRNAGLELPEMKHYFELVEEGESTVPERRELLLRTAERLNRQKEELERSLRFLDRKIEYYNAIEQSATRGTPGPVYQFDAINSIFLCRQEGCSEGDCVPPDR